MTEDVVSLDSSSAGAAARQSAVVAGVLFALALVAYFAANTHAARLAQPLPLALFTLLAGSYLALGVPDVARRLTVALARPAARIFAGPVVRD